MIKSIFCTNIGIYLILSKLHKEMGITIFSGLQGEATVVGGQHFRTDYARDGDPDWEENFYILRHSLCPAVLVEQFFMDNKKDLAYLISDEGKRNLIDVIVGGVVMFSI